MTNEILLAANEQHYTYGDALLVFAVFAGIALCLWALSRF